MAFLIKLAILAAAVYSAHQAESELESSDASPQFATVTFVDKAKGLIGYRQFALRPIYETFPVYDENGKIRWKKPLGQCREQEDGELALKETRVYDAKGRRLASVTALQRLKVGDVVLKSVDGKKVHSRYLNAVRDDVLVIVPPALEPIVVSEDVERDEKKGMDK